MFTIEHDGFVSDVLHYVVLNGLQPADCTIVKVCIICMFICVCVCVCVHVYVLVVHCTVVDLNNKTALFAHNLSYLMELYYTLQ